MRIHSEGDLYELYDSYLDDVNEHICISGVYFSPSTVLQECDLTAYDCGFSDWLDSEGYVEHLDGYVLESELEEEEEEEEQS